MDHNDEGGAVCNIRGESGEDDDWATRISPTRKHVVTVRTYNNTYVIGCVAKKLFNFTRKMYTYTSSKHFTLN